MSYQEIIRRVDDCLKFQVDLTVTLLNNGPKKMIFNPAKCAEYHITPATLLLLNAYTQGEELKHSTYNS